MANLQFVFQGCQKMIVRVPISQKANEVGFQFLTRILRKIIVDNAMIPEFLENFVCLFYTTKMNCANKATADLRNAAQQTGNGDSGRWHVGKGGTWHA